MFSQCGDITEIDFSNFDTSNVEIMNNMFRDCKLLTSLNLSNFKTPNLKKMEHMFDRCYKLEYINMKNFNDNSLNNRYDDYKNIFNLIPDRIVICINEEITKNKILPELRSKCYNIDCSDDWKSKKKNIITSINGCECQLDNCLSCSSVDLPNKKLCTQCNQGFNRMENNPSGISNYFYCYKDPKGYYLDKIESIYKKCFKTCDICEFAGDNKIHNCVECNDNYPNKISKNDYSNCYENCDYFYYFDEEDMYHCTVNSECPKKYPVLTEGKRECIKYDIKNMIQDIMYKDNETYDKEMEEEAEYFNNILKYIETGFISEYYDTYKLDNGDVEIIEIGKMKVILTTLQNQKNNINNEQTNIDLEECENLLRRDYNISTNETLYLKKIEIKQKEMRIPKVEYNIYSKLFGTNLIKLNLTSCSDIKMSLFIKVEITESLDELNISSGYYNDLCYTVTTNSSTDITLKDRKNEFIKENKTVCQEDCYFSDYNYTTKRAKCSCKIKESSESFIDMNINMEKIYESFIDIKNIANINLLSCYRNLFSKLGLIKNIGSYVIILIIIFHIVCIFIFYINQIHKINNSIKNIINKIDNSKHLKKNKINMKKINANKKFKDTKNNEGSRNKLFIKSKISKNIRIENENKTKLNKITNNKNIKKGKIIPIRRRINKTKKVSNKKKMLTFKNIIKYTNSELNILSYNEALFYDKRTYCLYYISLLKEKHNLIFSFFNNNDYNSKIIKIDLFFVGFTNFYTVNALFYDDDTMNHIYESKGSFDIEHQIAKIIYSSLISMILNTILKLLALSNNAILNLKKNKTKYNINKKGNHLKNRLRIKFIFYFIISFIFLLMYWYYIAMFGAIYKNTQIHLLKDTLISFGLSLIYPFGIYLVPGLFRIPSLSKKNRKCLYNFSRILQKI